MLCSYGCGKKAKYKFKNEKWCCSKNWNSCKENKKKISFSLIGHENHNKHHPENKILIICEYCKKNISQTGIHSHKEFCYLNPKNFKECPVCGLPIKKYKINKTCSARCGAILGMTTISNGETKVNYRTICFSSHGHKCLVCDEDLFVIAHHINGDRTKNIPENLIPLCNNHHLYIHHHTYYYLIKECIDEYITKFKSQKEKYE